jgi:hypothetical protein
MPLGILIVVDERLARLREYFARQHRALRDELLDETKNKSWNWCARLVGKF